MNYIFKESTKNQTENSVSFDLYEMYFFFYRSLLLVKASETKQSVVTAKASFADKQPGDLCFSADDKIRVALDLESDVLTFSPGNENWFVGATLQRRRSLQSWFRANLFYLSRHDSIGTSTISINLRNPSNNADN